MSVPPSLNPFVPGHGQIPPHLAGREEEQRELIDLLAYVKAGRGAPRNAVLSGPRGNGKTALLRWFEHEVETSGNSIDAVWLTPSEIQSLDKLATRLVPPGRFATLRPDTLSFSVGFGKLGWELDGDPGSLTLLLTARCTRRPLVVVLDEAHTLAKDVGQVLLNAGQTVCARAPFLLVMAGTPSLQPHLNTMSATFWSRAEKLGIGRLDATSAAAALTVPLAKETPPVTFDDAVLEQIVRDSQGYPYFLQLRGAALWRAAATSGATRIDAELAKSAAPAFDRGRSAYYEDRREELARRGLSASSVGVAHAFGARATLREHELDSVIRTTLGHAAGDEGLVLQHRDALAEVGYVWKPPHAEDVWQPGIPSLMEYVKTHAA